MELKDEQTINAPREAVYAALNDPEILKQCIPGCESLTKTSDTEMEAVASLKIGPVKAKFKGEVTLTDLNPPESYAIVGEGKGGAAGFAKGRADVTLIDEGGSTRMQYSAKADVGGKLAQLGSRLIDSTAQKLAGDFFKKFKEILESGGEEAETAAAPAAEPAPAAAQPGGQGGMSPWVWILAGAAVAAIVAFGLL